MSKAPSALGGPQRFRRNFINDDDRLQEDAFRDDFNFRRSEPFRDERRNDPMDWQSRRDFDDDFNNLDSMGRRGTDNFRASRSNFSSIRQRPHQARDTFPSRRRRNNRNSTGRRDRDAIFDREPTSFDMRSNVGSIYGKQLLEHAEHGEIEEMNRLLQSGEDPDIIDDDGNSPLIKASSNGHWQAVQMLIDRGAEVNAGFDGKTPLYWASCNGHPQVVHVLLHHGKADPRIKNRESGKTPLHWAAYHGHEQIIVLLMQQGEVDPNVADFYGKSPLQIARDRGHQNCVFQMESWLQERKIRRENEATLVEFAGSGRPQEVYQLLQMGIAANITNEYGQMPLYVASCNGHSEVVQLLLDWGADPNMVSGEGNTPLYAASWNGHGQVVQQLLDKGADPNRSSPEKDETPLFAACNNGQNMVLQILLKRGADPYYPNWEGRTPYDVASNQGRKLLDQYLIPGARRDRDSAQRR